MAVSMLCVDCRGQRRALAPRGLQLHQDRAEPLRQVVVNVAGETIALLEDGFAALLDPVPLEQPALMQREPRVPRDRLDERDAPPRSLSRVGHADRDPSKILSADHHRRDDGGQAAVRRVELAHGLRNPRIVGGILDRRHPAWLVVEQVLRLCLRLSNGGEFGEIPRGDHLAPEVGHPELAALLVFVEQPHAGHVALGLFGQRLEQRPEEPVEIGLAHEQVECVLRDLGLNVRETFRPSPLLRLARQRRAQRSCVARVDHALHADVDRAAASAARVLRRRCSHVFASDDDVLFGHVGLLNVSDGSQQDVTRRQSRPAFHIRLSSLSCCTPQLSIRHQCDEHEVDAWTSGASSKSRRSGSPTGRGWR